MRATHIAQRTKNALDKRTASDDCPSGRLNHIGDGGDPLR